MGDVVVRKEAAAVFLLSLGAVAGGPLPTIMATAIAPSVTAYLLLRRVLSAERATAREMKLQAVCLWIALNLVPSLLAVTGPEPFAAFPGILKSFLWMMILVAVMSAGAEVAPRGGARRLLGIVGAVLGLVLGSALLLAPKGELLACEDGACFKPLAGYSVTLLHTIESDDIEVHLPPAEGANDGL